MAKTTHTALLRVTFEVDARGDEQYARYPLKAALGLNRSGQRADPRGDEQTWSMFVADQHEYPVRFISATILEPDYLT